MRCIRCSHDSKFKERTNRICPKCRGMFAFEPQQGDPVTDMLFARAIELVSGGGRIRWGVEHLYYEICRALRARSFIARLFYRTVPLPAERFATLWTRWVRVHGKPKGLIERQFARGSAPPAPAVESDLADYSFDRAVICDRARTVDLLVANNFHFENNCAVLSIDGYPEGPFSTVRAMLKRNRRLLAVALHDATPEGCRLGRKLAFDRDWFDGKLLVVDLGLRPNHAKPYVGLYQRADRPVDADAAISAAEAKWLTKYRLELAVFRPEDVLKRLHRGLQAHANDDTSSGGTSNCGSFEGGSGGDSASDSGTDSFG